MIFASEDVGVFGANSFFLLSVLSSFNRVRCLISDVSWNLIGLDGELMQVRARAITNQLSPSVTGVCVCVGGGGGGIFSYIRRLGQFSYNIRRLAPPPFFFLGGGVKILDFIFLEKIILFEYED